MKIQLSGYFDRNFGDDVMQLILVNSMPEHEFYVAGVPQEFLGHFDGCQNVRICRELPEIDAAVNVIGSGFQFHSRMAQVSKLLAILHEKRFPCAKTAVLDCSADAPERALERWLMKRELKKYGLISCRDQKSEKIMSELAGSSTVVCHEDLVFSLSPEWILPRTGEGCLGVIPVYRQYFDGNYEFFLQTAKACDLYVQTHGKKTLIFAFDTGTENDLLAAMTIRRLMKYREAAEVIAYDSRPEEIFRHLARCESVISTRFHGVIAALLAGVPAAAVSDTSKLDILSEKLGFLRIPKKGLTAEALTGLIEKTDTPIRIPEELRKNAGGHLEKLKHYLESRVDQK